MRNKAVWIVFALGALVGAWVFSRSGAETDPATRIRQALQATAAAAEAQDLGGVLDFVSKDFKNDEGDRNTLQGFLFLQLRRGTWRKVFLVDTDIDLEGGEQPKRARVSTGTVLASGSDVKKVEDVKDNSAGAYRIDMEVVLEDDDEWRVVSASYTRAELQSLLGL